MKSHSLKNLAVGFLLGGLSLTNGLAESAGAATQPTVTPGSKPAEKSFLLTAAELEKEGFGAGVALIVMSKAGIENASVDDGGIIRVDETSKARAGAILEYHFYPWDRRKTRLTREEVAVGAGAGITNGNIIVGTARWDVAKGMSFAVEFGGDVIRSVGVGLQASWRDYTLETVDGNKVIKTVGRPFNLGLYCMVEPNVKVLADGLKANQALPTGDSLRFQKEAHVGGALVLSYSF
ncbi:MAG TPA: hypothetical protein VG734_10575 [Lacunisphaera sp.]|nr:hypothetical protein [Lacunisphaera sp.]